MSQKSNITNFINRGLRLSQDLIRSSMADSSPKPRPTGSHTPCRRLRHYPLTKTIKIPTEPHPTNPPMDPRLGNNNLTLIDERTMVSARLKDVVSARLVGRLPKERTARRAMTPEEEKILNLLEKRWNASYGRLPKE